MHTIIIDPGKNTVKTLCYTNGELNAYRYISKSKEVFDFTETKGNQGQFEVTYKGKKYLVGSVFSGFDISPTKANMNTYIKILAGLGYWLKKIGTDTPFNLAIGIPTSEYNNLKIRKEIENTILLFKKETITVDGKEFVPQIAKLSLYSEGMGLATRVFAPEDFDNKQLLVIDIGGFNINLRQYDKDGNVLLAKSLDSVGCNQVIDAVQKELKNYTLVDRIDLNSVDITDCICKNNLEKIRKYLTIDSEKEKELLNLIIIQFLEQNLLSTSAEYSIDRISDKNILLTGGGATMLSLYFNQLFKDDEVCPKLSINPIWENAYSYLLKCAFDDIRDLEIIKYQFIEQPCDDNDC